MNPRAAFDRAGAALTVSVALAVSAVGAPEPPPGAAAFRQSPEKMTVTISRDYEFLRYLPKGYDAAASTQWPLVVFLHGAGERGSDVQLVKRHGLPKEIELGREFPFIAISPQCPADERWEVLALEGLIEQVAGTYRVDRDRIYLMGLSMGGFGVWGLALRHPERYAAVVPVCGGGEARYAAALRDLPVWAFHGDRDPIVALQRSEEMIAAIRQAGGSPRFTVYPGVAHDSWTQTFANSEVYAWLLSQRRGDRMPR